MYVTVANSVVCYRQLCLLLDPKDIYCAFAEILLLEEDLKFASTMVRNLNMILLTSVELFKLRNELRDLKTKVITVSTFGLCIMLEG